MFGDRDQSLINMIVANTASLILLKKILRNVAQL